MDKFIEYFCKISNCIPLLFISPEILDWFLTTLEKNPNYMFLSSTDEIEINNSKSSPVVLYLIQLGHRNKLCEKNKKRFTMIRSELEHLVNSTQYSLPWISDKNVYSSHENYSLVMTQIASENLTNNIVNINVLEVNFVDTHRIHVIEFDTNALDKLKAKLENNPFLFKLHIRYAYTWYQAWTIRRTKYLDELIVDICAQEWKFLNILDSLDIFDLISLQIAIRGSTINQYLNLYCKKLIAIKLEKFTDTFELDIYLFENVKAQIHSDIFVYFCYEYGRRFNRITVGEWNFYDFDCPSEKQNQFKICSMNKLLADIKRTVEFHRVSQIKIADDPVDLQKLFQRISLSKHVRSIEMCGHRISYKMVYQLLLSDYIECISINMNTKHLYEHDKQSKFTFDHDDVNHTIKRVCIQSKNSQEISGEVDEFLKCLECILDGRTPSQPPFIHLHFIEVTIENFCIFQTLPINEITFCNIDLSWHNFVDLGNCTIDVTDVNFINCPSVTDGMLVNIFENRNFKFEKILIEGDTAVTSLIYFLFAENRILSNNLESIELIKEIIYVEQFKELSWQIYKHNRELEMIEISPDQGIIDLDDRDEFEFYT